MYFTFDEFMFIMAAVIAGILIYKISGSILKGIGRVFVKIGARVLRKELKIIEIEKAKEAAEKEANENM